MKFGFSCPMKLKNKLHGRGESGEVRIFPPQEAKTQAAQAGRKQ